jgi:hypothetical protein
LITKLTETWKAEQRSIAARDLASVSAAPLCLRDADGLDFNLTRRGSWAMPSVRARGRVMPAPAIHWWHMPQKLSQQQGMLRARAVLASTAKGEISGDEDTLRLVTSECRAIINCIRQGDHDIFTIMIVAGNNDAQTRAIMEEIRSGMSEGSLE